MTTILHLISSSNVQSSLTRQIGKLAVEKLADLYPGQHTITHDLVKENIPHLGEGFLSALFAGQNDSEQLKLSNQLVDEVLSSDILVIEAPMYNFGIPSVLKAWVDHVARAGKTFRYTENGPVGLATGKKAILIVSRGGVYSEGPAKAIEHQESYLRAVLNFIGITDIETIVIEGVAMGADKANAAMESAKQHIATFTRPLAA